MQKSFKTHQAQLFSICMCNTLIYFAFASSILLYYVYIAVDAVSLKKQALLLEEVQKLNQENAERSEASQHLEKGVQKSEDDLVTPIQQDLILEEAKPLEPEQEKSSKEENEVTLELKEDEMKDTEPKIEEVQAETPKLEDEESKELPLEITDILKDQEIDGTEDQTITNGPSEPDISDTKPATPTENSVQR